MLIDSENTLLVRRPRPHATNKAIKSRLRQQKRVDLVLKTRESHTIDRMVIEILSLYPE